MVGDGLDWHRRKVDRLRRSGELGHGMDRSPQVQEQRKAAANRRRVGFHVTHRHDHALLHTDGSRGCWGCHVRTRLEAWYRDNPELAPEVDG